MTRISRRSFLQSATLAACAAALGAHRKSDAQDFSRPSRPNVLIVLADDMGFSDVGCYGGEIATPHIDALAREGLRFTQMHNAARCCPTRASLLTGLYPHQVGLKHNGKSLNRDCITMAEALKRAGYDTAMAGKWHLSETLRHPDKNLHQRWVDHQVTHSPFGPPESYPTQRGFDRFYGIVWGVINYFDPFSLVEDGKPVESAPYDYYFTDAITDKAVEYIEDFAESENPFFLYYAHCAPHWPLHARPDDIAKYANSYNDGWTALRDRRFKRQLEIGLFDADTTLPPLMDDGDEWDSLNDDRKRFESRKMAVHAAMVDRVDQNLGRVIHTLKRTGQYENTILIFLSDNGASPERVESGPGYDRTAETRDGRKVMYAQDNPPMDTLGSEESYVAIGPAWANAANTPFRYWKKESYEGGSNTPCIIHWPNGLKGQPGSISSLPTHVMDFMPTVLELADAEYPAAYRGYDLRPLEGHSIADLLRGDPCTRPDEFYFEHSGGRAVRKNGWKLVAPSDAPMDLHLYRIDEDITEARDLGSAYPDIVRNLERDWQAWAQRVGV